MTSKTKKCTIIVVGDSGVGKTCLINRYARNVFVEVFLPIRLCEVVVYINDGQEVIEATLVDTDSREDCKRLRPLAYVYPKKPDVLLLCFSVDNRSSYENITNEWLPEIRYYLKKKPIILVGTRCDLDATITEQECHELKDTIKASHYVECSGKEGTGVKTVFDYAVTAYTNSKSKRRCTVL